MRATSRLPSFCVSSVCQMFDPAALISIAPVGEPGDLVGHRRRHERRIAGRRRVERQLRRLRVIAQRHRHPTPSPDPRCRRHRAATARRSTRRALGPGPAGCAIAVCRPARPALQPPPAAGHSLYAAATIGARSVSGGFVHVSAKLLLLRHCVAAVDRRRPPGPARVLSMRSRRPAPTSPRFPAVSCAWTTSCCVPSESSVRVDA